jgi:hypothetical protein
MRTADFHDRENSGLQSASGDCRDPLLNASVAAKKLNCPFLLTRRLDPPDARSHPFCET